jgi:N-acetylglucosamine malate deacetylase 1
VGKDAGEEKRGPVLSSKLQTVRANGWPLGKGRRSKELRNAPPAQQGGIGTRCPQADRGGAYYRKNTMWQLNEELTTMKPLDLLAIAAHPDDVEQTCGGTLIRMAEQGYRTGVLDLTAGDMGTRGTPETRIAESKRAAAQLLVAWRENLRWPDARLENTLTARMTLAGLVRRVRARTVILPYWTGRHPDHYRAAEIGYEACFLAGLKRLEEETPPHRPFKILYSSSYANATPSFVVDITRQFGRWKRRSRVVSEPKRSRGATGLSGKVLRKPDRCEVWRTFRRKRNHVGRRRRKPCGSEYLTAQPTVEEDQIGIGVEGAVVPNVDVYIKPRAGPHNSPRTGR